MEYKQLDTLTDEEIAQSFDIHMSSVYELEKELRNHSKREAELVRKAMNANKRFHKFVILAKITEAEIVEEIRTDAIKEGKPIASSALGEIRKSIVAKDKRWQNVQQSLNKARSDSELWSGLLSAWQSRGFRLQELAKIAERTLWNEPVIMESEHTAGELHDKSRFPRKTEDIIEDKLKAQNNLELDY